MFPYSKASIILFHLMNSLWGKDRGESLSQLLRIFPSPLRNEHFWELSLAESSFTQGIFSRVNWITSKHSMGWRHWELLWLCFTRSAENRIFVGWEYPVPLEIKEMRFLIPLCSSCCLRGRKGQHCAGLSRNFDFFIDFPVGSLSLVLLLAALWGSQPHTPFRVFLNILSHFRAFPL